MSDLSIGGDSDLWDLDAVEGDDDMGDDMGDDDDLELGGATRKAPSRAAKLRQAKVNAQVSRLRKRQALMGKAMQHLQPSEQTQVLPFPRAEGGGTAVLAGAIATVFARPQRPFQTQRFVWSSAVAPFFLVTQLTVGQENMFVQSGVVPAEVFSQTGVGVSLKGYIAYPGIDVTLQVENTDTADHPILASIIGAALV